MKSYGIPTHPRSDFADVTRDNAILLARLGVSAFVSEG